MKRLIATLIAGLVLALAGAGTASAADEPIVVTLPPVSASMACDGTVTYHPTVSEMPGPASTIIWRSVPDADGDVTVKWTYGGWSGPIFWPPKPKPAYVIGPDQPSEWWVNATRQTASATLVVSPPEGCAAPASSGGLLRPLGLR